MAYDTNWSFREEFESLMKSWIDKNNFTHNDWQQMHWTLDGLKYLATVKRSYPKIEDKASAQDHAACITCGRTSSTPDACIINFAIEGLPQWYCREHYPNRDGLMPPGWVTPEAAKTKLNTTRMAAWEKLTPEERTLMNRNIVSVASSGE